MTKKDPYAAAAKRLAKFISAPIGRVEAKVLAKRLFGMSPALGAPYRAKKRPTTLTIYVVFHPPSGVSVFAGRSEAEADRKLAQYCRSKWASVRWTKGLPPPRTHTDETIAGFFNDDSDEEFEIFEETL